MPKISVIIPVYNVEKYIRQALDSVINQTLEDIEIICVNDCTPDKSFEIVKEYASKDERFVLLEQEYNQGQGVARNRALNIAKGDYIMFLDPDDWFELDACEEAYNQISKNNNDIAFFNFFFDYYDEVGKKDKSASSRRLKTFENYINNPQIIIKEMEKLSIGSACIWAQIYNNAFLKTINARFSNTKTCEDNPFFFNALCNASTISVLNKELYHYRKQSGNSIPYYTKHWKDVLYNKNLAYEFIKNSNNKTLIDMFVPYYWNSIKDGHFRLLKNLDDRYNQRIFKKLHELAIRLNTNHDMKKYKDRINYCHFQIYLKSNNIFEYNINKIKEYIFSKQKKRNHNIIYLLGFKFSIRRSDEKDQNLL